ncbi:MAG: hypothetical protein IJE77_08335, partial [Thermoguttaceae bacterium]|nr:hypothetical protein [Thermoguttaceae bacterium]
ITGNVASSYGGGVYSEGTTFCANVLIAGNSGSYGGAFYGEAGTATFVNATLTGNSATKNGGGIYEYSASTTLCNAIVAQNAPNDVRIASKASIVGRNSLSSFTAWNAGEKNYVYNASLPLFVDAANGDYALADGSQAINKGNDAYAVDAEGNALQTDLAGRARLVGAVDLGAYEYRALETPSLVVTTNLDVVDAYDDKISLREAIRYAASNATLGDAITFAPSLKGATIKLAGERLEISQAGLTVDATSLYDATTQKPGVTVDADGKSRVFYLTDGTTSQPIAIKGLTITGGKTDDAGGGVYASGATTFANCVVSGNAAAYGGGVYASGATTFANCVVSGNAAAYGGGVSAYGGGVELVNCEISGNTATNYGGGVCVSNATFTNCSISGNAASKYGGGVYVSSYGAAMLCNTMIALNYGGEVAGALSSDSGNNQIGGDPKFVVGPVFDGEGNLTNADSLDLRLTAESWAVDRGVNDYISDVETDLAGNARVKRSWASSATVDIGAYEYQGTLAKTPETPSLVVTTNRDGLDDTDGEISLREAILYAETNANLGSTITFATTLKDKTIVLTDGELFISRGLTLDASKIYNATTRTPGIAIDADEKSRVFSASGGTKEKPIALIGLTIAGGKTSGVGGGVCFYCGTATFTDCAIVDNAASSGGGVYLEGSATFTNCSISDNVAKKSGGGVKMADTQKSCVFVNCLIKGNAAANKGGGVSLSWTESASFTNCSISANTATSGGGVHIEGVTSLLAPALAPGKMTLRNTIVALNTASSSGADINRTGYKTTINA